MSSPAERLFQRQLSQASASSGTVDMARLQELVTGAYFEADHERRRSQQTAELMAVEIEEVNVALEQSVGDLQAQNLRFGVALESMANGLSLFSKEGRLVVCNRRQIEILAIQEIQLPANCSFKQFLRASSVLSELSIQERLRFASAGVEVDFQQTSLDGREIRVLIRPTSDGGFLTSCEDVTERTQTAARIAFLAYHDILTELPNRVLLRERLQQTLERGACAVLCLDLDGFKAVNDTCGHAVGDALLRAVTRRLSGVVRAGETLARLGGDEFAAVLACDTGEAATMATRMLATIGTPFEIDGQVLNVGTSIGIAVAPADGRTPDELLRNADIALYLAKASGRGCYRIFEASMGVAMQTRRTLEHDLCVALTDGQFELHYQPQVKVVSGRITSFEALVRWHHPQRGTMSPDSFIPVAEESGLIIQIGEWVLGEACREAMRWPAEVGVAVNISTIQLRGSKLFDTVAEALRVSGLSPERLELEVTETAVLKDSTGAFEVLQRLRALGVRIAMDDFGTGYSSLTYLQSFQFDRIKIDRSFIWALGRGAKALAIVRAIIGLGTSLGIPVTAEGVETREQMELLTAERCNDIQGFLFSRPVPSAAAMRLLEASVVDTTRLHFVPVKIRLGTLGKPDRRVRAGQHADASILDRDRRRGWYWPADVPQAHGLLTSPRASSGLT